GSFITRLNRRTGELREVNPYPRFFSGENSASVVERWQWTFPIIFSPVDPTVLYTSSQHVWKSTNGGDTWERISADHPRHEQPRDLLGGVLTGPRQNGRERHLGGIGRRDRQRHAGWRQNVDAR